MTEVEVLRSPGVAGDARVKLEQPQRLSEIQGLPLLVHGGGIFSARELR